MFKNLKIKNYRILKDIEFEQLSYVNLLVGRNNVGKSTVLEAIRLFAKLGSPLLIEELLDLHDNNLKVVNSREKSYLPVDYLFTDRMFATPASDKGIYIGDYDDQESITLKRVFYVDQEISPNRLKNLGEIRELISKLAPERQEVGEDLPENPSGEEQPKLKIICKNAFLSQPNVAKRFTPPGTLITNLYFENYDRDEYRKRESRLTEDMTIEYSVANVPTEILSFEKLADIWDRISLSDNEQLVIEALKLIEPKVERLNFIKNVHNSQRTAIVKLSGSKDPIPLRNLGEGMSRVLQLILSLLQVTEGGFLLIDEFENGLHYSVQPKVWSLIFRLAQQFQVQVFATTHSEDGIKSFGKVWKQHETEGSFYRISLKEKIRTVFYDCEILNDAIDSDTEVR